MMTKKIASIILIIMVSVTWGCTSNSTETKENTSKEQVQKKEPIKATEKKAAKTGEVDKFGRKPGDQHYGHNHGSEGHKSDAKATTKQPSTAGKPDKFGRKPGDQHYGHNHE